MLAAGSRGCTFGGRKRDMFKFRSWLKFVVLWLALFLCGFFDETFVYYDVFKFM